ncbi:MAG: phage virion morphogenesis protein [Sulfuricellaceae bacterium]|nr:phage virion morphogenesis protein [Sulfuricellaceae bacterium]
MAMISIEVDDKDVLSAIQALARKTGDLSPALNQIGEDLRESTLRRFSTSTGPGGQQRNHQPSVHFLLTACHHPGSKKSL